MKIIQLAPLFLFIGVLIPQAGFSTEMTMPSSDFGRLLVTCHHDSAGAASATFNVFFSKKPQGSGSALMVSLLRPYYEDAILNTVRYRIRKDKSISFSHSTFDLEIEPGGMAVYKRRGKLDTPPDAPAPAGVPFELAPGSVREEKPMADYLLLEPIELRCLTPFTKIPVPTGFSTGN